MAGLTLGGLASGMDTDAVITQLMAIEARGKTRLLGQQYRTEARKTALDQVATRLKAVMSTADDLRSVGLWGNVQTVESSDAAKVGATFKSGAAVGSYSINVTQLARASQQFLEPVDPPTGPGTKSLTFGYTDQPLTNVTVEWEAGATLESIATQINGKTNAAAFASVVNGQLVLSGKQTGVNLTVSSSEFVDDPDGKSRGALPAQLRIDNGPVLSSSTNTFTNAMPGVELTVKSLTATPVTVSVGAPGPDQAKIKEKVNAFVKAYNDAIDFVRGKLNETPVKTPATQADFGKGVLRNDIVLQGVLSKLREKLGGVFEGDPDNVNPPEFNQLADLGIGVPAAQATGEVTADRLAGKLVVDDTKLTNAIATDPNAIRRLFGGITDVPGISQTITGLIDPLVDTTKGSFTEQKATADRELARIRDAQTLMDARLKLKEERLRRQFTAMEQALSNTQSTTSWMAGQIAGLAKSS